MTAEQEWKEFGDRLYRNSIISSEASFKEGREAYKSALRKAIEEEIEKESRHIRESYNDVRKRHELKRGIWHQCLMKIDTVTPE